MSRLFHLRAQWRLIKLSYGIYNAVALAANNPIHVSTGEIFSAEDIWQHQLALKQPLNSSVPTTEQRNWAIWLTKSASEPTIVNPDHPNQRKTIRHWLIGLNHPNLQSLADHYFRHLETNKIIDNSILALLAEKTGSTQLSYTLVGQIADEYSY